MGVILAAALLSALPQFFQIIDDFKLLVYGLLLFWRDEVRAGRY